ncbi:phosphate acetyltransferase [Candidatus Woesearchaeota archaeon]|nr:phosphate acetyltransferase [Candidatus Woesearchaeota archaeon]
MAIDIVQKIKNLAKKNPKTIVYPEACESRTIRAVELIVKQGIAKPLLLCSRQEAIAAMKKTGVNHQLLLPKITIIDYRNMPERKHFAHLLYQLRKKKGMTIDKAHKLMENPIYYGTMMVKVGEADGLIGGAFYTTAQTVRPALQIIKTKERFHRVSGLFLMELKDENLVFADCSVNIDPDARTLAEIAIDSATTAEEFGLVPRVALLSFSTHGSAEHPVLKKLRDAVKIVRKKRPDILIDGELQVDAALLPSVAAIKCKASPVCGKANVLIFPDVSVGNIAYKLVERLAGAKAIGPILQGLALPVNDLSRGCSVEDIVDVTAVTVVQAQRVSRSHKHPAKKR